MRNNLSKEIGLYIHFPFCIRKCAYCDFASEDWQLERIPIYIDALIKEIEIWHKGQRKSYAIRTLYFGGGTPNLIGMDNFQRIMRAIRRHFVTDSLEEFTVEVNLGLNSTVFLEMLRRAGVDRLSLGCQSFNPQELKTLRRIHSVEEIENTLNELEKIGFKDFSLDLIYGIPGQTLTSWQKTLVKALQTGAEHLSLYCLSYEVGTPLYQAKINGKLQVVDEELEWRMYEIAHEMLERAGFRHYEISNWAKPGHKAIHNSIYWKGGEYLGFGAAAHSYDGKRRWWNEGKVDNYIKALQENRLPIEGHEELNNSNQITEMLFLGLRTAEGLNIRRFEKLTGRKFLSIYQKLHSKFCAGDELFKVSDRHLILTLRGWFICDSIIEEILKIIEEINNDNPKS